MLWLLYFLLLYMQRWCRGYHVCFTRRRSRVRFSLFVLIGESYFYAEDMLEDSFFFCSLRYFNTPLFESTHYAISHLRITSSLTSLTHNAHPYALIHQIIYAKYMLLIHEIFHACSLRTHSVPTIRITVIYLTCT